MAKVGPAFRKTTDRKGPPTPFRAIPCEVLKSPVAATHDIRLRDVTTPSATLRAPSVQKNFVPTESLSR